MRSIIAGAPHGWLEVVEGGAFIYELGPHTKLFYKTRSHGKRMVIAKNPSSVSIPLTWPNGDPFIIPQGCYFKEVPIRDEEMTEDDRRMAWILEAWHAKRCTCDPDH